VLARRAGLLAVAAIALLALVETAAALVGPHRAPTDADWRAAAQEVRAGFQTGDLIVAAPAWADPILRVHLGDLIPPAVAGRLDDDRFGRVWEVSQRGARASAATPGRPVLERRFGALTVRRIERPPALVSYDFVAHWTDARVTRVSAGGTATPCRNLGDRVQCPDFAAPSVRPQIAEVDTRLRQALVTQAVPGGTIALEYPAVRLGRAIEVGTGLHNVWFRKQAQDPVDLRVVVGVGAEATVATVRTVNEDGWKRTRIDTTARAGQTVPVRLEVSAPGGARTFAVAAEARE